jgi:hypothetical protein
VRVLAAGRLSTPTLAGAIEGTDPGLARNVPLHPSPARRALSKPIEQDHSRRPRTRTPQIEAVAGDEVGAAARRRVVARRRLHDGFEGAAKSDERQEGECRVEKRPTRPVVQGAPRTAHRPDDNERKQKRPDPPQPAESAIARPENEKRKAGDAEA